MRGKPKEETEMSTRQSIAHDESFHLYREMLDDTIQLECKAEASLDSCGNLTLNLSKLKPELIAALAKQLTKMAEVQK